MAADRKLSDADVARLRGLAAQGVPPALLGPAFGVSPQHAGRLMRGEQRQAITGTPAVEVRDGAAGAVEAFLAGVELERGDEVLAATARAVAAKLDACAVSEASAAAQALPRLAAQLVEVLDRLRLQLPREPDFVDQIKARGEARRLAAARDAAQPQPEPSTTDRSW